MKLRTVSVAFACATGLLAADPVQWPQYRGPQGSGISETAGPVQFGPKQNLLWAVELPQGHSSPSIWGDHIFLSSFDKRTNKLEVIALDRRKGAVRWRQAVPVKEIEKVHDVSSPATATPVTDGERVYSYFGSAGVFCHDMDGKLLWSSPMPTAKATFGSGTSPVLLGDTLLVARDDAGEQKMVAINRTTGQIVWTKELGGQVRGGFSGHATPVVWKDQVLLHRAGEISAYAVNDGSRQWGIQIASQGTGTPVISGDTLFVAAWGVDEDLRDPIPDWQTLVEKHDKNEDGFVSKEEFPADLAFLRRVDARQTPGAIITFKQYFGMLDGNQDGLVKQPEWESVLKLLSQVPPAPHGLLALRLGGERADTKTADTKTNVAWSADRAVPEVPMPLAYKNRVYTVANGGIVSVYDSQSGKLTYRSRLGAGGLYYASPVAAGDKIYFASGDGVLTVIEAGSDKLEVLARNDIGEPMFATPSPVDGTIYVRTVGHLYAFQNTK